MRTKYLFREAGEPMMLSTSWEPLALTGRTPVMLPEEARWAAWAWSSACARSTSSWTT